MKLCDLTSGPEGIAVWPVQWAEWGDPGGGRSMPEAGVPGALRAMSDGRCARDKRPTSCLGEHPS